MPNSKNPVLKPLSVLDVTKKKYIEAEIARIAAKMSNMFHRIYEFKVNELKDK